MERISPDQRALTDAAASLLSESGFRVAAENLGQGADVLMAENRYAVAMIVEAKSWRERPRLDELQTTFANWAAKREAGPRMWDLYLVLLLQDVLGDEDLVEAERFAGDLQLVRKIVRAGLPADRKSVADALASLLPLEVPDRTRLPEPLADLEEQLVQRGLSAELARRAVAGFVARRGSEDADVESPDEY